MPSKTVSDLPASIKVFLRPGKPRESDVMKSEFYFLPLRIEFGTVLKFCEIGVAGLLRWEDVPGRQWIMENIEAGEHQGWGPLIYDFAMEFVSQPGFGGLVACGRSMNHLATSVWEHYFTKRKADVDLTPLPPEFLKGRSTEAVKYIYKMKNPIVMPALAGRIVEIEEPDDVWTSVLL